jgi:putative FmdB family regulatory protein
VPTYQYACTACDERLEAVQSFTDAPLTECPACGGALRKVFSAVGVVFKGSGFYKTDSRGKTSDGAKTETKADSGSGDKATATASTGSKDGSSSSSSTSTPAAPSTPASKSA